MELVITMWSGKSKMWQNNNNKTNKEKTENQGKPPREVGGLS
jgi:hypothetical protein